MTGSRLVKVYLLFLGLCILLLTIPSSILASAEPDLTINTDLQLLFGEGGGSIEIIVQGDLASVLREDIVNDSNYFLSNPNATITQQNIDDYSEAVEDLLERNINQEKRGFIDKTPAVAGIDYNGNFKIIKIERVDITEIEGLLGTNAKDTSKFKIKIDVKGSTIEDTDAIFTDGYIILYALWGEKGVELPLVHVEVKENIKIMTINTNGYSDLKLNNGGKFNHYRLIAGDYIEYSNDYRLNGYSISNGKNDSVKYGEFSIQDNSLLLFIILIIFTILAKIISKNILNKYKLKPITFLRIISIIFFIIVLIPYFIGFIGIMVLVLIISLFVVNLLLTYGIYLKDWGNLSEVALNRDEFIKEPPKIYDGPWHERGISNAKVGNFEEALNCFEMALEAEPENATIWNDLGFVQRKLGNYRQAIDCFNKAIDIRPNYSTAINNLEKTKREMKH